MFEELNGALVLLGRVTCAECAEVLSLASLRVGLPRVEPVLSSSQFPDHAGGLSKSSAIFPAPEGQSAKYDSCHQMLAHLQRLAEFVLTHHAGGCE